MSSKKRQQTFAKLNRERAVKERRALKEEKKRAAREAKANENAPAETQATDAPDEAE